MEYEDVRLAGEEWDKLKPGELSQLHWSGRTEWVTPGLALLHGVLQIRHGARCPSLRLMGRRSEGQLS